MWSALTLTSLPVLMPELSPAWTAELAARTIVSMWLYGGLLMLMALARGAWYVGQGPARDVTANPAVTPMR